MASTILVKDLVWRIAVLLQDTAPQFQRWPERELIHWLNDAQRAIAKYLPMSNSRVDAVKLAAGTRQSIDTIPQANIVPGDGVALSGPVYGVQLLNPRRNMGANGSTPGRAVRMVERDTLDSQDPDWHTRTGSAVSSVIYDPQTPKFFYVTPGVTGDVWLEIAYAAKPLVIPNTAAQGSEAYLVTGDSTVTIGLDDEYADDLVDYVVARANMKDFKHADPVKHKMHKDAFIASLNAKVAAVTGNSPNITTLPGVSQ
jgi:hypothetical protein